MDHLVLVDRARSLMSTVKQSLIASEWQAARDLCLQSSALLDGAVLLLRAVNCNIDYETSDDNNGGGRIADTLHTCQQMLRGIGDTIRSHTHGQQCSDPVSSSDKPQLDSVGVVGSSSSSISNSGFNNVNSGNDCIKFAADMFTTNFDSIAGCTTAKNALFENVVLPFNCCDSIAQSAVFTGIRAGCGNVLLHGPPGTGKTLLAQAVANEANAVFVALSPSDVLSKFQGESERYLKSAFEFARSQKRAIIFFDEFDSLAAARGFGDDSAQSRRLLSELLMQMTNNKQLMLQSKQTQQSQQQHQQSQQQEQSDQQAMRSQVVVIAATNRLEDLDEAIIRRFDAKIFVGLPDSSARGALVQKFMRDIDWRCSSDELRVILDFTAGWPGSDIELLCREAAMVPVREALAGAGPAIKRARLADGTAEVTRSSDIQPSYSVKLDHLTSVRAVQLSDFVSARQRLLPTAATNDENCGNNSSGSGGSDAVVM